MLKYKSQPQVHDWIKFSSKLELRFYKYFQEKGIEIVQLQPHFILQDSFKYEWKTIRRIEYIADFRIRYNGDEYIVDSKGFRTSTFDLKKKLWLKKYGWEHRLIVAKSIKELETLL